MGREVSTLFFIREGPKLPLEEYVQFLVECMNCSPSVSVAALVYVDRFCELTSLRPTEHHIHKLLLVAMMCAFKFWEDRSGMVVGHVAECVQLPAREVASYELLFLMGLQFALVITEADLQSKLEELAADNPTLQASLWS